MFDIEYLNSLRSKYNYDEKTTVALGKIIPSLIDYYGEEYEELILTAIFNTKIIPCDSYQTISKVKNSNKLTKLVGAPETTAVDVKANEGVYSSDIKISYDEFTNSYKIDEISRIIVTAHTYNYDSPKGLEVLVYCLVKLIKSYENEYTIFENTITKRSGISTEERNIIKDKNEIYLEFVNESFKGLEEGFNIYDTSKIVSLILRDDYHCYDYDSIYTIASIMKDKFKFANTINKIELTGTSKNFIDLYPEGMEELSLKCDECLGLEHEMFISMFRNEKDELAKIINKKLSGDIFQKLMEFYKKGDKIEKER